EGQTFATMRVPSWGNEEYPISEGISDHVLDNLGLGRFPTSSMPGAEGNFALAGHRTLHSKPLYRINELEVGDEIIVTTDEGEYTYAVSEYEIVTPDQVRVIEADPHNPGGPAVGQLMTLVACHPLGSTAQRWVTYAELEDFQPARSPSTGRRGSARSESCPPPRQSCRRGTAAPGRSAGRAHRDIGWTVAGRRTRSRRPVRDGGGPRDPRDGSPVRGTARSARRGSRRSSL